MRKLVSLSFVLLAACSTAATPARPAGGGATAANAPPAVEERTVASGDVTLFVRVVGDDRRGTLVALHGGPGLSHEYLRPLEALAADGYRVVLMDQRGSGRSSAPANPDEYRLADLARDVEAVRQALGVERLDLLGHSYGGLVALAYAGEHAGRLRSLVTVDSVGPHSDDMERGQYAMYQRRLQLEVEGVLSEEEPPPPEGDDCSAPVLAMMPAYFHDPRHPAATSLGGASCRQSTFEATLLANMPYDLRPGVAGLTVPTLIVHGVSDGFGLEQPRALLEALPQADVRVEQLLRCGHLPFIECPEPFFVALRGFLAARP